MNPHILFTIGVTFIAFPVWLLIAIAIKDKPPMKFSIEGCLIAAAILTTMTLLVAFGIRILRSL